MKIVLPFPDGKLSGHQNTHWRVFGPIKKRYREWARLATLEANPKVPETGDIPITIRFVPGNNRGDRVNYPNRLKPYFDGIADALGVNDKRFNPFYIFAEAEAPGRVEFYVG